MIPGAHDLEWDGGTAGAADPPDVVAAIRVRLRVMEPVTFRNGSARPLHAALHRALEETDAALSRRVHSEVAKSFGVSPLYPLDATTMPRSGFRAGDRLWVRITTLEREVLTGLLASLATHWREGRPLMLDWGPFRIEAIEPIPHRGADGPAVTAYGELASEAIPARGIALRFVSPVVFRNKRDCLPPVDAWRVFGSYLRRWEAFSDIPLPGVTEEAVRAGAVLPPTGRLERIPLDVGFGGQTGYAGEVRFRVDGDDRLRHGLAVLAAYAAYCGTGSRTAFGMGQTRPSLTTGEDQP